MTDKPHYISRRIIKDTSEPITIPTGHAVCPACQGHGSLSKYDQGWSSVAHDPKLAALQPCLMCHNQGYVERSMVKQLQGVH